MKLGSRYVTVMDESSNPITASKFTLCSEFLNVESRILEKMFLNSTFTKVPFIKLCIRLCIFMSQHETIVPKRYRKFFQGQFFLFYSLENLFISIQ